ncbi:tetratricopeptide repeat protein [Micromonospora lupini]|uniref:tetratricopeptide repeat protein n=1 Tax=Micromonospora lupini TaxID=285679 RepID=UPI002257498E|nr:tetratricopeptide repeat protein [Micromonospora lupini]MCX5066021.1 tetratricopeptide repeat protein [Micromonospora lupini]
MSVQPPERAFVVPPDPGRAGSLEELVDLLRVLKVWAGDPSYDAIRSRVNAAWTAAGRPAGELTGKTTVADCFRAGRRRLNTDLVISVVRALHPDEGYVTQWRQALQMITGEARAASQVHVQDRLPPEPATFTGRAAELSELLRALRDTGGGAAALCVVSGMAGAGKTHVAVHAAHLVTREQRFDRVLFVNLRGFHADPAQPAVDPAAVLEGFLRLLGMPFHQIPLDLAARTAAYRRRLAGSRTLVVLDNAAGVEQVRPLLTDTAGCPMLVTSRRDLTALRAGTKLTMDVFAPGEAMEFLALAAPRTPVGDDPQAPARIALRCGHLPLALGLVAGHIRATPGWTLTDHADRLDERHRQRRLDTNVQLALDLSYQHLPAERQRLLRLMALHPGQDLDAHAAAALAGSDLPTTRSLLLDLSRDHLVQPAAPGRYTLHDLVRAHAAGRAADEDPPSGRRTALTRLFDFYLAGAAAAMDTLYPAEAERRPAVPRPAGPAPDLSEPAGARVWLDTERPTLVAVAAHTASHGWATHAIRLSGVLFRYLDGGYFTDALTVHEHARDAARDLGDPNGQAHALAGLGATHAQLSRHGPAAENLREALRLFRQGGDRVGEARALINLGVVMARLGRNRLAAEHCAQALVMFRQAGHQAGEAHSLTNLGSVESRLGRHGPATDHFRQALTLIRQLGNRTSEAWTLNSLGEAELRQGRHGPAINHLRQALGLYRQLGNRVGEAWTLDILGTVKTRLGRPDRYHRQALAIFRETGDRSGEASALNGLGEASHAAGDPWGALAEHSAAHTIAVDIGELEQQARAHTGIGRARETLSDPALARQHYQQALILYTELGTPEADLVRARLTGIDDNGGAERRPATAARNAQPR